MLSTFRVPVDGLVSMSSLGKCLLSSSAHFLIALLLFLFFALNALGYLRSLGTNPVADE